MNFSSVQNLTSEDVTVKPYQDFSGNYIGDINSYIAGIISIISNVTLIYATSQSIEYEAETESLYIIKNGFYLPVFLGESLLTVFIVSIVMSCNGPAVQYLQVAVMLSSSSRQKSKCSISIMPVLVAVPTVILVYFGYVPQFYDVQMSEFFLERLSQQGVTSLLIVTVHLASATVAEGHFNFDMMSQVCTFFILMVMFLSLTITVFCYLSIRKQMECRRAEIGAATQNTQEQLNTVLLIQFLFPFLTIHIPFYITFILPFFNNEIEFLTDNMLYLCAWCPAINPIIVMVMVKVIKYFNSTESLFIIKNGFSLPTGLDQILLVIFIVSIVMFCNAPTVQYLQVTALLKATSKQDANFFIYLIPLTIGVPTVALTYFGYIPHLPVIIPTELPEKMKVQGVATFLIVPMAMSVNSAIMPLICTIFILFVMIVSIIFAIYCFIRIKMLMKEKFASSTSASSKKSQEQLNTMLLIQVGKDCNRYLKMQVVA